MSRNKPLHIWFFAVILSVSFCSEAMAELPFPYTRYRTIIDSAGVKWYCFGEQGGGASRENNGEWTVFTEDNSGLEDDRIDDILIDGDKTVWFVYSRDVNRYVVTGYDGKEWNSYYPYCLCNTAYIDEYKRIHLYIYMMPFEIKMNFDTYYDGTTWQASPREWGTHPSGTLDTANPLGAYENGVPAIDYFPLSVGSTWKYKRTFGDHEDIITLEIIGTGTFDGETYAIFRDGRAFRQDSDGNVYLYGLDRKYFDFTVSDGDSCKPYTMVPGPWGEGVTRRCFTEEISGKHYEGFVFGTNYGSFIGLDAFSLSPGIGMVKFVQGTDFTPMDIWELIDADIRNYPVSVEDTPDKRPEEILCAAYPNPFNPVTTIEFSIPAPSDVRLIVYSVSGQKAATLADGYMPAGKHTAIFDGSDMASGLYFYRLEAGKNTRNGKMLLVK